MNDAARAEAWEDFCEKIGRGLVSEHVAFDAGWNAAAKQTAALREENARLREVLEDEHRAATMLRALPDPDDAWEGHRKLVCYICALLADPEGQ